MKPQHLLAILLVVTLSGCATVAPPYQASFNGTNMLKDGGKSKVKIGEFRAGGDKPEKINKLTIRGGAFSSPTNKSYTEYLKGALRQQLYDADRLDQNANVEVSGIFLENVIDGSGFKIGFADISARFIVRKSTRKKYDRVITVHHEWPSSFAGATAIPAARQNYPIAVQKLIEKLLGDRKFIKAIR